MNAARVYAPAHPPPSNRVSLALVMILASCWHMHIHMCRDHLVLVINSSNPCSNAMVVIVIFILQMKSWRVGATQQLEHRVSGSGINQYIVAFLLKKTEI